MTLSMLFNREFPGPHLHQVLNQQQPLKRLKADELKLQTAPAPAYTRWLGVRGTGPPVSSCAPPVSGAQN